MEYNHDSSTGVGGIVLMGPVAIPKLEKLLRNQDGKPDIMLSTA